MVLVEATAGSPARGKKREKTWSKISTHRNEDRPNSSNRGFNTESRRKERTQLLTTMPEQGWILIRGFQRRGNADQELLVLYVVNSFLSRYQTFNLRHKNFKGEKKNKRSHLMHVDSSISPQITQSEQKDECNHPSTTPPQGTQF